QSNRQGRLKFETALHTLQLMKCAAIGVGLSEVAMPLSDAFDTGLSFQPPMFLAANLIDKDGRFPEMFRAWIADDHETSITSQRSSIRVGYVGVVGKSVIEEAKKRDSTLTFSPAEEVLPKVLGDIKAAQPKILVLLFQGSREEGKQIAERFPQFQVVLTLDDSDEPSALPDKVGDTLLVSVGHKGKYVGLVGVYRRAEAETFDLRYELAALSQALEPPDEATNPAREQMRDYV